MNLAVNARDAMPAGGTLRIATANVVANPELVAGDGGVIAGPTVTLTITDTGHGMNAETQTRVFEPFFTTKEPGKGTGLGLSMVYGIVKQSGGEIHVRSVPGWGSTFTIAFPQVADRHVAPRLSEAQVTLPTGTETVLIVEDEPTVQLLVTAVLTALGYTVLAANGGEAALAIAQSHPGPVDLLVTDMVMPGMGGREVAMRLSVGRPELQVLFMSGFPGEAAIRQRTLEVGSAFIQKPFTPLALARKVRETLDD
jgi:CheY-like chemotaxis protein